MLKSAASTEDVTHASPPARRFRSDRPRRARLILALIALLAVLVGLGAWIADRWNHVYLNDARIAANVVALSSEVSGQVSSVSVVAGDHVAKGALLVAIESVRARFAVEEIDAQLERIDAGQSQLRAQQQMVRAEVTSRVRGAESQMVGAEADRGASAAELEGARAEYKRTAALHEKGFVSVQRVDEARTRLTEAQQHEQRGAAAIETARANLMAARAAEQQISVLERQVATLAAERNALKAKRAQLKVDLDKREIRAAFDGVIDQTFVVPGAYVSPGTRLLMYHDPTSIWVDANVKETDLRLVKEGAPARVTVDAYPGREFHGTVVRIGNAATSQFALLPAPNPSGNFTKITQRLPIRVRLNQESGLLRPGMMVEVDVDVLD